MPPKDKNELDVIRSLENLRISMLKDIIEFRDKTDLIFSKNINDMTKEEFLATIEIYKEESNYQYRVLKKIEESLDKTARNLIFRLQDFDIKKGKGGRPPDEELAIIKKEIQERAIDKGWCKSPHETYGKKDKWVEELLNEFQPKYPTYIKGKKETIRGYLKPLKISKN